MGQSSEALEGEVSAIREVTAVAAKQDREQTQREKLAVDRHFAALLQLLGGRIDHFTRVYGLMDMQDDARTRWRQIGQWLDAETGGRARDRQQLSVGNAKAAVGRVFDH